jgi:hypothetical protein
MADSGSTPDPPTEKRLYETLGVLSYLFMINGYATKRAIIAGRITYSNFKS